MVRSKTWRRASFGVASGLVLVLSAVVLTPASATETRAEPQLLWQPCAANAAVECASIPVPVDWAKPDDATVDIAVAKRKATDPARRIGTLAYAPAGPGSSGVESLTNDQYFGFIATPEQAARFDVVSFDPRGVRGSNAVVCDEELIGNLPGSAPRNQEQFTELLDAQVAIGRSCRDRTGPVIDHLDSNNQARDLDALRGALGESKLNIYALSYGTVLGQMYAELFPDRIRTMVLDANVDHSADTERLELAGARAAQESFEQFAGWCESSAACELHGHDVRAVVADLFARADAGVLPDPQDPAKIVDRAGVASAIAVPLDNADVARTAHGIALLAGLAAPARSGGTADNSGTAGFDPSALPIYISCADHRNTIDSYADQQRLDAEAESLAPDVKMGSHGIAKLCVNPPFETTNPPHELDVHAAAPIMVTNSRYDGSTPHESAARVASQIDGSSFVTYDGMGHGAAVRSQCMKDIVLDYYVDQRTPPPGTNCPAEPLP